MIGHQRNKNSKDSFCPDFQDKACEIRPKRPGIKVLKTLLSRL